MAATSWDILLVDDEAEVLRLMGDYLRHHGLSVLTTRDSFHTLKQLKGNKVAVIVLDVNLAGEDGVTLVPYIKQNHPGIPIILYTGLDHDAEEVKNMLARGAARYISKAQPPADLLAAIREFRGESPKPN